MKICIFCSAYVDDPIFTEAAKEVSEALAKAGCDLVWGGSYVGLMKTIADAFQENGGKLYGYSLEIYRQSAHPNADEMVVARELGERKGLMLRDADAILVLPGGIGTLDELTEVLELKKQGVHDKAIVVLNTNHFYDGLQAQLEQMNKLGFIPKESWDSLVFANTTSEAKKLLLAA